MIHAATRIVAVDDERLHLNAIVEGLNGEGMSCLPVVHPAANTLPKLPHIRLVFMDLHLTGSNQDLQPNFRIIETLISEMSPEGPYAMILWTHFPSVLAEIRDFFRTSRVRAPVAIRAIDKASHISADNKLKDVGLLKRAIRDALSDPKQLAALVDWENCVLEAASNTIRDLANTVLDNLGVGSDFGKNLDHLLSALAVEAVGKGNVGQDRFSAVREALAPLMYDHVTNIASNHNRRQIWDRSITRHGELEIARGLTLSTKSVLNRMLHVAHVGASNATARGALTYLDEHETAPLRFEETWGISPAAFREREMRIGADVVPTKLLALQVQAGCDFAQAKSGLLPFVLGLEIPAAASIGEGRSAAVWTSPPFSLDDPPESRRWLFHFRFVAGFTRKRLAGWRPSYRMRSQLLNALTDHLHAHGSRLGIMSFDHEMGNQMADTAATSSARRKVVLDPHSAVKDPLLSIDVCPGPDSPMAPDQMVVHVSKLPSTQDPVNSKIDLAFGSAKNLTTDGRHAVDGTGETQPTADRSGPANQAHSREDED